MSCRELDPLIVERASGELAAADAARLDAHLEGCERCRTELRAYQETLDLVRLPPDDGPAIHLEASTFSAYQRRRRRRVTRLTIGAGIVAAAIAASVVLAPALLTLRSLPPQRPATSDTSVYAVAESSGAPGSLLASSDEITVEDAAMAALDEAESP